MSIAGRIKAPAERHLYYPCYKGLQLNFFSVCPGTNLHLEFNPEMGLHFFYLSLFCVNLF